MSDASPRGRRRLQQDATPCNNILRGDEPIDRFLRRRNELTQRQQNAVEMLLQGLCDQEVATRIGVDRTTVFRWRQNIAFARELDRQRRLRSEQATNQLQSMLPSALKILQQQLDSAESRERMRAVSVLLRFATPSRLGTNAAIAATAAAAANGAAAAESAAKPARPARNSAEAQARAAANQHVDDLIAYIEAPLPGEPGCPEEMADESDDEMDPREHDGDDAADADEGDFDDVT